MSPPSPSSSPSHENAGAAVPASGRTRHTTLAPGPRRVRLARPSVRAAGGAEALRLVGLDGRTKQYHDGIVRQRTDIENVVLDRAGAAHEIADALPKEVTAVPKVDLFIPEALQDALFVGHLVSPLSEARPVVPVASFLVCRPPNSDARWVVFR